MRTSLLRLHNALTRNFNLLLCLLLGLGLMGCQDNRPAASTESKLQLLDWQLNQPQQLYNAQPNLQLVLRFNQPLHIPGASVAAAQLAAIQISPQLPCVWSYPDTKTLACAVENPAEGEYQLQISADFKGEQAVLAENITLSFAAGGKQLSMEHPRKFVLDASLNQVELYGANWNDTELTALQWRLPSGEKQPVHILKIKRPHDDPDYETADLAYVSIKSVFTTAGDYQLLQPERISADGQKLRERELWRGSAYTKPRLLSWYCNDGKRDWIDHPRDPRKDQCATNQWVLDKVGNFAEDIEASWPLGFAPARYFIDDSPTPAPVLVAPIPHPKDDGFMWQFQLAGQHQYRFLLNELDGQSETISFTTQKAATMWTISTSSHHLARDPLVIPWPEVALNYRQQQLKAIEINADTRNEPYEFRLGMPNILSQQEHGIELSLWQRRFYSAGELQAGLNAWWQTAKGAEDVDVVQEIPAQAWLQPALWQQSKFTANKQPKFAHHETPLLSEDNRPYLAWYQLKTEDGAISGTVQQAAFNLQMLNHSNHWLQVFDWMQQPVADAVVEQVCPSQPKALLLGHTNALGQLLLELPAKSQHCWLWVSKAAHHAAIALPEQSHNAQSHNEQVPQVVAHMSSNKPMYLPGEPVHILTILRQRSSEGVKAPEDTSALIWQLTDRSNNTVQQWPMPASTQTGLFSFEIPAEMLQKQGGYQVALLDKNREVERVNFIVQSYELPLFTMKLTSASEHFGDSVPVSVQLESFTGQTLANAKVAFSAQWLVRTYYSSKFREVNFGDDTPFEELPSTNLSLSTDSKGQLSHTFTAPLKRQNLRLSLAAETTDLLGESQSQYLDTILRSSRYLVGSQWLIGENNQPAQLELRAFATDLQGNDQALSEGELLAANWRESADPASLLIQTCAENTRLPHLCNFPDQTSKPRYLHIKAKVKGQLIELIQAISQIDSARVTPEATAALQLDAPESIASWQPTDITITAQQPTSATLLLQTQRIEQVIPLKLKAGVNKISLPLNASFAPAVNLTLVHADNIRSHETITHTILQKEQLSEFKLSTALLLQGKPIAEAKPEAMLEIELNAAENADVALFWLDESLLYLQGENSSFLKELDPKAMFAKGYSWSQYSQLQSLGAEATLAEHARFIHPFTNNYAESIAFGFSGDQTRMSMRMRVPAPPPFVKQNSKSPPIWLGIHQVKAGQTIQLKLPAPAMPGRWQLVAYAAGKQKVAFSQSQLRILDELQGAMQGPVTSFAGDEATASLMVLNLQPQPMKRNWQLRLDQQLIAQGELNLAPGERNFWSVPLPDKGIGNYLLAFSIVSRDGSKTTLQSQQHWQVQSTTTSQQQLIYTADSKLLQLPISAQLLGARVLDEQTPNWPALFFEDAPQDAINLLTQWLLHTRITGKAPAWAKQRLLPEWLAQFTEYRMVRRFDADEFSPVVNEDALPMLLTALAPQLNDEHLKEYGYEQWLKQLQDQKPISGIGWWLLAAQQRISPTQLLQARSQLLAKPAQTDAPLPAWQQRAQELSVQQQSQFILALQQFKPQHKYKELVKTWQAELLGSGWQEPSYHNLSAESACWLLNAVDWHEPRVAALKLRLLRKQQAEGHFGNTMADLLCGLAFRAQGQPFNLLASTPIAVAATTDETGNEMNKSVALSATSIPGQYQHTLTTPSWLEVSYQQPISALEQQSQGLVINKRWLTNQRNNWQESAILQVGDLVKVEITVDSPVAREHVLLSDPLLPGSLMLPARYQQDSYWWQSISDVASSEPRQVQWYRQAIKPGRTVFSYYLQIKTAGNFQLGISRVETKYDATVFASTAGDRKIEVKP